MKEEEEGSQDMGGRWKKGMYIIVYIYTLYRN